MKSTKYIRLLKAFAAALLLAATGCQMTPEIHTKQKPKTDFSSYRSFTVLPLSQADPTNGFGPSWGLPAAVREAAASALVAHGLAEASCERAELCVLLRGMAVEHIRVDKWYPGGTSYPTMAVLPEPHQHYRPNLRWVDAPEPRRTTIRYHERTLVVEIFDNKSKEALWAGWATTRSSRPVEVEQVTHTICRILGRFPPK